MRKKTLKYKRKHADDKSKIDSKEVNMRRKKGSKNTLGFCHVIQPECSICGRFAVLKSPCPPENCIYRILDGFKLR